MRGERDTTEARPGQASRPNLGGDAGALSTPLKKVGLALHNHHSAFKQLPPRGATGNSKLSWRVHVLPFLGEQELYREFKLDEPWDSEHNAKLVERMPEVFAVASLELARQGKTRIVFPFHEKALYHNREQGAKFREVTDGLSNTIMVMVADSDQAVIWTKPDDLAIDLQNPKRGWSEGVDGKLPVLIADGSVRGLSPEITDEVIAALLTRAGRERIDR